MRYSGINGRTLKMLVGGVISTLAMVLIMTLPSCNKNPMEVETLRTNVDSTTVEPFYNYITIHTARIYNFHDVGLCWPRFWLRKYRLNVDFTYSYYIRHRFPIGAYFKVESIYLHGYKTNYNRQKVITDRWGYIHIQCYNCRRRITAYTCKIDNPIKMQISFQFFNYAGRVLYQVWSNIYYVPVIKINNMKK